MFVFFVSIIKSQSNVENIYAPSAGYYSGGFLNLADDGLDAEVFLNLQNKLGLYNNIVGWSNRLLFKYRYSIKCIFWIKQGYF